MTVNMYNANGAEDDREGDEEDDDANETEDKRKGAKQADKTDHAGQDEGE